MRVWARPTGQQAELWTLSGKDGRPLRASGAVAQGYEIRALAKAGDADADGIDDYVVTNMDVGSLSRPTIVEVRSGRDERVIWQATNTWQSAFGLSVEGNLDLDGDGRPDVVVTAPAENPHALGSYGAVYAYSNGGTLLYRIGGTAQMTIGNGFGSRTIARVGDVDLDGADDFVVGGGDPVNPSGLAIVISGRTGKVLVTGRDDQLGDNIGDNVDGCGDMDGDGIPDFVSSGRGRTGGVVRAFSGRTGAAIHTWRRAAIDPCFGASFLKSEGIDVDLDGVPDVIVANQGCGSLWVLSGRDGSIIFQQLNQSGELGGRGTVVGVQPGSPFPVFAVPQFSYMDSPGHPFVTLGRLLVYRGSPKGVEVFGLSCRGTAATTPRIGARDLGASGVRITLKDGTPGAPAALFVGLSRTSWGGQVLPYPLAPLGLPGCSLNTSIDLVLPTTTGTVGLARGYASFDIPTRLTPTGRTLHAQWWCHGGKPLELGAFSDALLWHY
jgi:hypothetical protein